MAGFAGDEENRVFRRGADFVADFATGAVIGIHAGFSQFHGDGPTHRAALGTNRTERTLHGLVLLGGRSSRMGTDKAALLHPDGRPLARRTHDLLVEAGCESVVLSLRCDQELPAGFDLRSDLAIIRDPAGQSQGPLAGMLAAMKGMPQSDWLVLACDLPRLDLETLLHLVGSRQSNDIFLSYRSEFDGLPEPLCAFYAAEALPILEQFQAEGVRCPRKVLIRNHCRLLDAVTRAPSTTPTLPTNGNPPSPHDLSSQLLRPARRTPGPRRGTNRIHGCKPAALYQKLDALHRIGLDISDLRAAVNDEFVSWDHPLNDGDRIAFLPPMSGG